jgi:SAM-dependent methyltransferase
MSDTLTHPQTAAALLCPICGSTQFGDFRNRVNVRCRGCGGFERSRLLWLVLNKLELERSPLPFLHVAPEIGIAKRLHTRLGDRYRALDFDPAIYEKAKIPVGRLDLCQDLAAMPTGSIMAMCHVHVLEHVRCNAALVLQQINRVIAPGGFHVFGVPFFSKRFREDLSDELSNDDRFQMFGHEDHVRSFGHEDFELMFGGSFDGMEPVNLRQLIPAADLERANVPPRALHANNSHSLFVYRKR